MIPGLTRHEAADGLREQAASCRRLGRHRFTALQASKRTGILDCELKGDRVVLGGHAVTVIEGYFQI